MGLLKAYTSNFRNNPWRDGFVYGILVIVTIVYSILALCGDFIQPACDQENNVHYPNPEFDAGHCLDEKYVRIGKRKPDLLYFYNNN